MVGRFGRRIVVQATGFVLVAVLILGGLVGAFAAELRIWTDRSGQHQIKARLVRVEGDKVVLQREDGSEIRVELAKLNEADQAYAKSNAPDDANPFQRVAPSAGGNSVGPFQAADDRPAAQESGLAEVDWSAVKTVSGQPVRGWRFTVGASASSAPVREKPITLPGCSGSVAWCQAIVSRVCHRVLIGYVFDRVPAGRETALVLCDLQTGRVRSGYGPGRMTPLALSDSGDQALMLSLDAWRGRGDLVELWSLTSTGVQVACRWHAHAEDQRERLTVRGAAFLPEGKLATFSGTEASQDHGFGQRREDGSDSSVEGQVVVWALNPLKPLYRVMSGQRSFPAVSPDGKYLAFAKDRCVDILDVQAGQLVAAATLPEIDDPVFAFSPQGTRLAVLGRDKIYAWEFATGKLEHTIPLAGVWSKGWIMWTSEGQILDGQMLFDLERERKLWEYEGSAAVMYCDGVCWFVVPGESRQPPVLVPVKIPHPEALRKLRDTPIDYNCLLVAPGVTVRLVVDGIPEPQRENVRAALLEKLQVNDCKVGESSPIELVASMERAKPSKFYLDDSPFPHSPFFSPPRDAKTYTFQGYSAGVKYTYRGEVIWQASSSSGPPPVREMKQDETIDQFLRRHEKPDYDWFHSIQLPKTLMKTQNIPVLGKSRLSATGLEETHPPQFPRPAVPGGHQ